MRHTPVTLPLLCTAQFLVVLDVTIVAVALPDVRAALGFSREALQWVVTAYTLAFGGLLIPAGRAADLAGRRRAFRAGLAAFGLASLGCGLAPSSGALVALRTVQGAGAAMVAPAALALLTAAYPEPDERRRAVGWWTAAAAGGGASGWVLGGVLVEALGWPAVFLVNVPVCAAALVLAPRVLAESRSGSARRLDLPGALTVTAALALLVHGLTETQPVSLATAAAALAAFALVERRAPDPIVPRSALRLPFVVPTGAAVALTATTTPPLFLAVLYQQEVLDRSALATGLACAPVNLAVIAASLAPSPRGAMPGGLCTIAAGALLLISGALLPAFVLIGAGLGVASVASTAAGTAALGAGEQGVASGVLNAAAQIGTVLGLAVLVSLDAGSYTWGFAGAAAIALAAAALVTRSSRRSRRRPTTPRR